MDFSKYKFRCSGLHNLMTTSRGTITTKQLELLNSLLEKDTLTEKQQGTLHELIAKRDAKPELSDTTKTYLRAIYIKEVYGRIKPDIKGPAVAKGTMVEADSLDLVKSVTGKTYFKNLKQLENSFITGTPDVITRGKVIDIKSSWSIFTFSDVDEKLARQNYFYQMLGYMWLTGKRNGHLMYCLVNTPNNIALDQLYRLSLNFGEEAEEKYKNNFTFDDIPEQNRLKIFKFSFDQKQINELKSKIYAAREYLNTLSL